MFRRVIIVLALTLLPLVSLALLILSIASAFFSDAPDHILVSAVLLVGSAIVAGLYIVCEILLRVYDFMTQVERSQLTEAMALLERVNKNAGRGEEL